jgi:hypothetical protein
VSGTVLYAENILMNKTATTLTSKNLQLNETEIYRDNSTSKSRVEERSTQERNRPQRYVHTAIGSTMKGSNSFTVCNIRTRFEK